MSNGAPPAGLQQSHLVEQSADVRVLVHRGWEDALPAAVLLAGTPLERWGSPVAHDLHGRGPVSVLSTARGEVVAKAYTRGGLLGGVARRLYADGWRPAREAVVAEALRRAGLPTPEVVAARSTRAAPGLWRLEIATARVPRARDLLLELREARTDPARAQELALGAGALLRRLHDAGLRHRDLQVKNVLVAPDDGAADGDGPAARPAARAFHVIDLDRCSVGAALELPARLASLARFSRSLVKQGLLPGLVRGRHDPLPQKACRAFVEGYGALPGTSRAELLEQLTRRLRRSLAAHEWWWRGREGERGGGGGRSREEREEEDRVPGVGGGP